MWIRLTLITYLLIACCAWAPFGDPYQTQPADLPVPIATLKAKIQGKKPDEVLAIIRAQFGREARSIGSGLIIPQWDVAGGLLTFHPFRGPSFNQAGATDRWSFGGGLMLIDTHNEVGHNIPGNYQMSTLPNNYRNVFWIGEVILQVDGRYRFERMSPLASYTKDASNFFITHPSGLYTILYPKTVQESSSMENLPDKSAIATLEFVADLVSMGGLLLLSPAVKPFAETLLLDLRINASERTLYLTPRMEPQRSVPAPALNLPEPMMYEPLMYQLYKSWEQFWNYD